MSLERRINYNFEKLEIRNLIVQSVFKTALKKKKEGNLRKVTLRKNSCLFKISPSQDYRHVSIVYYEYIRCLQF